MFIVCSFCLSTSLPKIYLDPLSVIQTFVSPFLSHSTEYFIHLSAFLISCWINHENTQYLTRPPISLQNWFRDLASSSLDSRMDSHLKESNKENRLCESRAEQALSLCLNRGKQMLFGRSFNKRWQYYTRP